MKIDSDRLALTQELHALVIDYWHDVDTNWVVCPIEVARLVS